MSNESTEPESGEDVLRTFLADAAQATQITDVNIAAGKTEAEFKILAGELSDDQIAAHRGVL